MTNALIFTATRRSAALAMTRLAAPRIAPAIIGGLLVATLGGCIQVRAPDKPIEINLNVKVQQEVVVRLQQDAKELIQNNPELFPE